MNGDWLGGLLGSPAALAGLEAVWIVAMAGWILQERRPPVTTLAWILGLSLLPVVGVPVYLVLGPRRLKRRLLRRAAARQGLSGAPEPWKAIEDEAPVDTRQLLQLARTLTGVPGETATGLTLFDDGDQAIDAIVEAIGAARDHVHLEYYIFSADRTGTRVRDALVERAARRGHGPAAGRRRRLLAQALLPGAAAGGRRPGGALQPGLRRPGLGPLLQLPHPPEDRGLRRAHRLHRRRQHHRQPQPLGVGQRGLAGHQPPAHRQRRPRPAAGLPGGLALRPARASRSPRARCCGRATSRRPGAAPTWCRSSPRGRTSRARARPASRRPATPWRRSTSPPSPGPAGASGSPRPTCSRASPMAAALETAALRGVDVQLLVPVRTDSRLVDAASRTYWGGLLAAGVDIYRYGPPMVHAKTCVIDDRLAIVGTANLDNRSLRLNFEVVVAIHGGPKVEELAGLFRNDLAQASPCPGKAGRQRLLGRVFSSLARLLSPQL